MSAPAEPATLLERGIAAYRQRQFDAAVELLQRALALEPANPQIDSYLAEAQRYLNRHDAVEQALDRLVARTPDDPWAWFRRGRARRALGRPRDAIADFDRAEALEVDMVFDGDLAELYMIRAECYEALGELRQAIGDYELYGSFSGKRYVANREVARLEAELAARAR